MGVGVDEFGGEAGDAEVLARRPQQFRGVPTIASRLPPPRSKHSGRRLRAARWPGWRRRSAGPR
jgi:hypothetical protein